MCRLLKLRSSVMSGKLTVSSLILIFCFAECAAGSCLSYGHSCWGAHGKRSGASNGDLSLRERILPIGDTKWVLSRLIQPNGIDVDSWKTQNDVTSFKKHQNMDTQTLNGNQGQDEQDFSDFQEMLPSNEDVLYLDDPLTRSRIPENKLRLYKLMKKNSSTRLN